MLDIYSLIGRRIREERHALGLSIEKLAELAELTPSFLGLIERGDRKMSVATLNNLCVALQVSPEDLMGMPEKRRLSGWDRKISFVVNMQPEPVKELVYKTVKCLLENLPAAR